MHKMDPTAKKEKLAQSQWGAYGAIESVDIGLIYWKDNKGLGSVMISWWKNKRSKASSEWNREFFPVKSLEGWDRINRSSDQIDPWLSFSKKYPGVMVVPHRYLQCANDEEMELWLIVNGYVRFVTLEKASSMIVKWLVVGKETKLLLDWKK